MNQGHSAIRPGQSWIDLLSSASTEELLGAFSPNAELESSVLPSSIQGAMAIRTFFFTLGEVCESMRFTAEYGDADRTCLEWEAVGLDDRAFSGSTLVHKTPDGKIGCIRVNVLPFQMILRVSSAITQRLADVL